MECIPFDEVANLNARKNEDGYIDQEDDLDEDLNEEFVIDDDTSGLDESDSCDDVEEEEERIYPQDELQSKINGRLDQLLKDRKVTNEKQRKLQSEIIADLSNEGDEAIVAMGGKGAKGNQAYHWKASKNDAIKDKLKGGSAEEISLELEMKMLANVGLVGFPNAGKSTLLRTISRATPKVAAYPFTTLRPRIGMVEFEDYAQISVADLPGIIEGAHYNRGLGFTFLRHIERTSILCFVVSMSQLPGEPIKHFKCLLDELEHYQPGITTSKKTVLAANKVDLGEPALKNYEELQQWVEENEGVLCPSSMPIIPISAKKGDGIIPLLKKYYEYMYIN